MHLDLNFLASLKGLCNEATMGPWSYNGNCRYGVWQNDGRFYVLEAGSHADAAYVAAANPTVVRRLVEIAESALSSKEGGNAETQPSELDALKEQLAQVTSERNSLAAAIEGAALSAGISVGAKAKPIDALISTCHALAHRTSIESSYSVAGSPYPKLPPIQSSSDLFDLVEALLRGWKAEKITIERPEPVEGWRWLCPDGRQFECEGSWSLATHGGNRELFDAILAWNKERS